MDQQTMTRGMQPFRGTLVSEQRRLKDRVTRGKIGKRTKWDGQWRVTPHTITLDAMSRPVKHYNAGLNCSMILAYRGAK